MYRFRAHLGGITSLIESRGGVWWLGEDPEESVPGTLVSAGDWWHLDLIGTLRVAGKGADRLAVVPPMTIFGRSLGRRYTLRHAYLLSSKDPGHRFDVPDDGLSQADNQYSQRWRSHTLLENDSLPEDSLFEAAVFELTGLASWWPFSGFRGDGATRRSVADYQHPEPSVVDCGDGLVVSLTTAQEEIRGIRSRSSTERVVIEVHRETGFTLTWLLDRVIDPLRGLIATAIHHPVKYFNCRLQPRTNPGSPDGSDNHVTYPIRVDPEVVDAWAEHDPYGDEPTFTAKDVDVSTLIPKWLRLAQDSTIALDLAQSHEPSGSLQSQVMEAVNAAETLHRTLYNQLDEFPFAAKVWEILKQTEGLTKKERKKVRSAVKITEITLEARLLQLAGDLGAEVCSWLFRGGARDWACVSAAVRNALSHGYLTRYRVEQDVGAMIGVRRLTQAVIQLRMLTEAGIGPGRPLARIVMADAYYCALADQAVVDWQRAAAMIREPP